MKSPRFYALVKMLQSVCLALNRNHNGIFMHEITDEMCLLCVCFIGDIDHYWIDLLTDVIWLLSMKFFFVDKRQSKNYDDFHGKDDFVTWPLSEKLKLFIHFHSVFARFLAIQVGTWGISPKLFALLRTGSELQDFICISANEKSYQPNLLWSIYTE